MVHFHLTSNTEIKTCIDYKIKSSRSVKPSDLVLHKGRIYGNKILSHLQISE